MCAAPMTRNGVRWRPLAGGLPETADLYIANRGDGGLMVVIRLPLSGAFVQAEAS